MKKHLAAALVLLISFLVYGAEGEESSFSDHPEILFLLGGQSNMAGNGFTADLPETDEFKGYRTSPGNVSVWNAKENRWGLLEMKDRFGPEIGFAHTIAEAMPDKHIGIIKYAVGGTSMDQWNPGGKLYSRLMSDFYGAKQSAPNATLSAVLWHQGESDSDDRDVAQAYRGKLIRHINALRNDTGDARLLFIYGQINPGNSFRGRARWAYAEIVRKAQEELDVPGTSMVKTDDCEKNAYLRGAARTPASKQIAKNEDHVHYSAEGQIKMGRRFAETYLERVGQVVVPRP